jgi:hypothetical protein
MTIHMKIQLIVLSFFALLFSGAAFSAEPMSADALKSLLTNNTMNCKNLKKNEAFTNYYRDDGTVTKLTSNGEKLHGKWRVDDNGQHCQDWGKEDGECCNPVFDKGNGTYLKFEDSEPKAEFTVTEGNPKGL